MSKRYVLAVDQSTQGTKSLLFDENGGLIGRADLPHEQRVNERGWCSHNPDEIYRNVLLTARMVIEKAGVKPEEIVCYGISNQRETALAWDETGRAVCDAIVWQCSRSKDICDGLTADGVNDWARRVTGIPVSPYFPASKLAWILQNVPEARALYERGKLYMGTVDTYLIYRLTGAYKTDYSNASRTALFSLEELTWSREVCTAYGIDPERLAQVVPSDSAFGMTDLGGLLPNPVPLCAVMGDSHSALFGQGCHRPGLVKATYGTGSSVMMNIGDKPMLSEHGLVTSLAWNFRGKTRYVMEGNINYTGGVITWLQKSLGLVASAGETEALALKANPDDTAYLVPAFSGLGAPYWRNDAKAAICGMTRLTGKAEIVKAALCSIAYQIADIVLLMERDAGMAIGTLRVDGGPTRNRYLMQFQSDILHTKVEIPDAEELSGIGAAYMAGLSCGVYDDGVFGRIQYASRLPGMADDARERLYGGWRDAVGSVLYQSAGTRE